MVSPHKRRPGRRGFQQPPRRVQYAVGGVVILFLIIVTTIFSWGVVPSVTGVAGLSKTAKLAADIISAEKLPKLYNVFGDVAHRPPEQADSSHGRTKWYTNVKWLHPWSSETTLDENRAVLPPLAARVPIYTYYDSTTAKDKAVQEAEQKLLLTWRRAWWAQGFKPVVLGKADAAKHQQYPSLEKLKPTGGLEHDCLRWLAFGHMGAGILANWLTLPMAQYEDETLTQLRRGNFPTLLAYKGLGSGLYTGPATEVNAIIKQALGSASVGKASHMIDLVAGKTFEYAPHSEGIAYYDMTTIKSSYKRVADDLSKSQPVGLNQLQQLINAHLHITWQDTFVEGIAVVQPHPLHMTTLVDSATRLAQSLLQCPQTPLPESCPPNRPTCTPCSSTSAANVDFSTPPSFRNRTKQFTIGTVPHPYTFNMLHHMRERLDVAFIRRHTDRDLWIKQTTFDLMNTGIGGPGRLTCIKEAIAGPFATSHSLWMVPELESPIKADWIVGFALPIANTKSVSGVAPKQGAVVPTSSELARENMLLAVARETIVQESDAQTVKMVEKWNLADTEAWRFAKSIALRRRLERENWLEEESKFAGTGDSGDSFM